ncbi:MULTISPECIES: hypothetical protein [Streptomyces]|uniref:hypothetical protein n=1 Tax=Streptomyces TaxID=1883 RepID=UPI001C495DC1|nr:hypothetical protein [Streptomyces sp. MW-W600-10]MBV7244504.1 hypothetical protein [Streptomyces sp. MW-W600-10]
MVNIPGTTAANSEVKSLPFTVVLVVSVAVTFVCAESLDFPWWLRLITVMGTMTVLEAANQAVGRARARRKAALES